MDYESLIGTPFEYGGRGMDKFDCYGLVRHILKVKEGTEVPDYLSPKDGAKISAIFANQLVLWERCEQVEGAVVVIRIPGNMHCGYMINYTHMIHTWEGTGGVTIEPVSTWHRRIIGYYKYVGQQRFD